MELKEDDIYNYLDKKIHGKNLDCSLGYTQAYIVRLLIDDKFKQELINSISNTLKN